MLASVAEHVGKRVTHLPWGREHAMVEAVGEHLAATTERAVHRAGDADGEALHRAAQRASVLRLDDEMHVIALHRVLDDAAPEALARARELCNTARDRLRLRRFAMPDRIFIVISTGAAPPSVPRRA